MENFTRPYTLWRKWPGLSSWPHLERQNIILGCNPIICKRRHEGRTDPPFVIPPRVVCGGARRQYHMSMADADTETVWCKPSGRPAGHAFAPPRQFEVTMPGTLRPPSRHGHKCGAECMRPGKAPREVSAYILWHVGSSASTLLACMVPLHLPPPLVLRLPCACTGTAHVGTVGGAEVTAPGLPREKKKKSKPEVELVSRIPPGTAKAAPPTAALKTLQKPMTLCVWASFAAC